MKTPLLIALAVVLAACGRIGPMQLIIPPVDGGGGGGGVDAGFEPTPSLHAAFTLVPTFASPTFILSRPTSIEGVLTLAEGGNAVSGTIPLFGPGGSSLVAVRGTLQGDTVTLEPGAARLPPFGNLEWQTFSLALVEGGSGSATGMWTQVQGDVIDSSGYTAKLTAAKDVTGATAVLEPLLSEPYRAKLLPTDALRVRIGEPVSDALARSNVRLAAAGQPLPVSVDARPIAGRVTSLELRPGAWLPFDADISLDVGGLTDPIGNAIQVAGTHRTVPDPGPMLTNPDFEQGMAGWAPAGQDVRVLPELGGVMPASGAKLLAIRQDSAVAAYFDVPSGATRLSFSVALLSELGMFDAKRTATVKLYAAGREPQLVLDGSNEASKGAMCDCGEYRNRVPLERHQVDVTALRGQRVFLVAEVRSSYFIGVTQFAMVLDDLRLE